MSSHFFKLKLLLNSLIILSVIATGVCFTQTGQIKGHVTDEQTGEPLANVNVTLKGTTFGAATSRAGSFTIERVTVGKYTLVISRIGYETVERKIIVRDNEDQQLSFTLSVQPVQITEIVVERELLIGDANRISAIPGSAHYIGQAELEKYSYNDIHRVLQEIPGVNIQEEEGFGLRPNIGMRGTGVERSQKITLMEDGVLIAPAPYTAPAAYYFPSIGRMQGIEVRKGSSQIKYGPYTTGGALNMISSQIPAEFQGHFKLIAGENSARTIHATVGDAYKNFGFMAETYQIKNDGYKELDSGGDTGFDKKDYMVKLRLNTNRDTKIYQELTLKLGRTNEVSNETYLGLTDADFERNPYRRYAASQVDQMNSVHEQYQVRHFIQSTNFIDVTTTVYRNNFKRNWYKLDRVRTTNDGAGVKIANVLEDPIRNADAYAILAGATSANNNSLEVKANNRKYYAQGIQSIVGVQFNVARMSHQVEIGLRYHEDKEDRFQWIDQYRMDKGVMKLTQAGIPGTESNRISTAKVWATFIQYNVSFGNLTAIPGLRYENIRLRQDDYGRADSERTGIELKIRQNHVSVVIPGFGLSYNFTSAFSTFAGIHKGFSPPGTKTGTQSEESINYELGMRYRNNALYAQGVVFFNNYANLLGSDLTASGGEGTGDLFNGGEIDVKGVELNLNYDLGRARHWGFSIPIRVAYTYTDAKFKNDFKSTFEPWGEVQAGFELPYLPRHQLAGGIGLDKSKWGVNLNAKYISQMRTDAGKGDLVLSKSTDAHLVLDASAKYEFTKKNKLFISVQNLIDVIYIAARRPAGVRPGLPRKIMGGIKADF